MARAYNVSRGDGQAEGRKGRPGVRIEYPSSDPEVLQEAHRMHEEVMAILAEQEPEETLEEVMARLRGRPWRAG